MNNSEKRFLLQIAIFHCTACAVEAGGLSLWLCMLQRTENYYFFGLLHRKALTL
jgi:hypothetical protein